MYTYYSMHVRYFVKTNQFELTLPGKYSIMPPVIYEYVLFRYII